MKKAIVLTAIMMMLIAPGMANASFFSDTGDWWMAEDQWSYGHEGGVSILDANDHLEVTASGVGQAMYFSNWTLSFNEDFSFSVNFHFNPAALAGTGGIFMGGGPSEPDGQHGAFISAGEVSGDEQYMWKWNLGGDPEDAGTEFADRAYLNGILSANYNATSKEFTLSSDESGVTKLLDMSSLGADSTMSVYLAGGSEGALFTGSEAYFSNFQLTTGTPVPKVAPEPVSSALFLLGGAVFAARQYRKRGKKSV